ncbi:MAG: YbjQ family protein [archaeon]
MITTTTDFVPGREVKEIIGIVKGSTIRAKHIGKDIMAGLKQIIGGELKGYTEMINEARDQAMERMTADAKSMKADAIINVRLQTSQVMQAASEVLAYGTAVKLK